MMRNMLCKMLAVVLACTLIVSCTALENANRTQKGAGAGAAGGAVIGGLVGGVRGALIGAAIGGVAGGLIGNHMDKQAAKIEQAVPGAQVERVGEVMEQISVGSKEQNEGVESVNGAMGRLSDSTQHNAASAEESASAALELTAQSKSMREMVESFTLSSDGRAVATVDAAPVDEEDPALLEASAALLSDMEAAGRGDPLALSEAEIKALQEF